MCVDVELLMHILKPKCYFFMGVMKANTCR